MVVKLDDRSNGDWKVVGVLIRETLGRLGSTGPRGAIVVDNMCSRSAVGSCTKAVAMYRYSRVVAGLHRTMRCTRVTKQCRHTQKYFRDGAGEMPALSRVSGPLQVLVSPGYLTLESLAAGRLCIRDIKTALNLSRPATCHDERSLPVRGDLRVARSRMIHLAEPKAELRALPRQRSLSIDTLPF